MSRGPARLTALLLAALLVGASCGDSDPRGTPVAAAPADGDSALSFADETAARGLDFVPDAGITGKRWMPEQLGSGAALFDADGDRDLDVLFLNGGPLPDSEREKENALYLNDGRGRFTRSRRLGDLAAGGDYGQGCAVADVDLDGDLDVFVSNWGRDRLYLNDGHGVFVRAENSGIASDGWGASCAFGDVDGDGLDDLYVTNYLVYDIAAHEPCYQGEVEIYCGPQAFPGGRDVLYLNRGGGRFEEAPADTFDVPPVGKGLGVAMADHDGDGDLDIYVANDQTPNLLYENDGRAHFQEIAGLAGVHVSRDGAAEAGMGVAFADYDNDGRDDVVVTNFEDQVNAVYRNEGDGLFMEMSWELGIGYESRPYLGWGVGLHDLDHDGWKDLFFGNGHVYDNTAKLNDSSSWPQKNRIHLNEGGRRFAPADGIGGAALAVEQVTRGVAFGDIDDDGDIDVLVLNLQDTPQLLVNQLSGTRWLTVATRHEKAGTPLLGARVIVRTGELTQTATVQGGYSFLTHNDTRLNFGLGQAETVDELTVVWVGGRRERYENLPANHLVVLTPGRDARIEKLGSGREVGRTKAR